MLRIELLADHSEAISTLATWFEAEWPSYYGPEGPGDARRDLLSFARREALPIALVAFYKDELCGSMTLKAASLDTHPHLGPWAAAGLIAPAYRRRGVGTALVEALEVLARRLGYSAIYSGTATARGLLERRKWERLEELVYQGVVVSLYRKVLHEKTLERPYERTV